MMKIQETIYQTARVYTVFCMWAYPFNLDIFPMAEPLYGGSVVIQNSISILIAMLVSIATISFSRFRSPLDVKTMIN